LSDRRIPAALAVEAEGAAVVGAVEAAGVEISIAKTSI
jgi:hypothetical protein